MGLLKRNYFFKSVFLFSLHLCASVCICGSTLLFSFALVAPGSVRAEDNGRSMYEKADQYFKQKNYKEAKKILNQVVAKVSPLEHYYPKARLLLANLQEDFTVSIAQFKMLATEYAKQPTGEEAQKGLGARYYLADKYEDAVQSYEEFLKDYPNSVDLPEVRYWYASSLMALDKNKEALDGYKRVVEKAPDSPWAPKALLGMGNANLKMGKYEDAQKQYLRILDQYHYYEELNLVYFKLGQAFEGRKKFKEAQAAYQTLLDKFPRSFEVNEAKIRISELEKDHPELSPDLAKASPSQSSAEATATPVPPIVASQPTEAPTQEIQPSPTESVAQIEPTPTPVLQEEALPKPFHVQVGVFSKDLNVQKARKELKAVGYASFVVKVKTPNSPLSLYKVRVGRFEDRASAEKLARELTSKLKQKAIVVED